MDLNVIHGLNKEISDKYNVIPVKEDEKNITLLGYNIKEDELDYLKFIYRKKVILREVSEENFKEVKNMIFTFREGNTEDNIIFKGIEDNASDIHFEPQGEWVNIRHRINGTLVRMHKIPNEEYVKVISKIKLMSGMDIAEKRKPQDGKSVVEYNGKKYDLRV
ncbi:MAG: ATPase, T2SS/T4P/T4SS family, partial [Clostridium butyricum]